MSAAPTDLEPLVRQMMRLMRAKRPAVEMAAARIASPAELLEWLAAAQRRDAERRARKLDERWNLLLARSDDEEPRGSPPEITAYLDDSVSLFHRIYRITRQDKTFDAYFERTRRALRGRGFGLQVPGLEGASWAAFARFRQLAAPIAKALGPRTCRFNCFVGDYRRTPFGTHFDVHHAHTFQYVVFGTKYLRAWHPRRLLQTLGERATLDALRDPLTAHGVFPPPPELRGGPGALFYWPGSYVHCMEANGPSAGLGVIFDTERISAHRALREELSKASTAELDRAAAAGERSRSPASGWSTSGLDRIRSAIVSRISSEETSLNVAHEELLERSRFGSFAFPILRPVESVVDDAKLVPVDTHPPWLLHRHYAGRTFLASNGHGAEVPWVDDGTRACLDRLVRYVNGSATIEVGRSVARLSKAGLSATFVRELFGFLVGSGSFVEVNRS